jgi:hypothetical protein
VVTQNFANGLPEELLTAQGLYCIELDKPNWERPFGGH